MTPVIVLTTVGADFDARPIARELVEQRLAACVNVSSPMTSTYRWQGGVEAERERQVVIKTTRTHLAAVEARVRSLHPYELPELVVIEASASDAYAARVREST